jgi:hypothetical protein
LVQKRFGGRRGHPAAEDLTALALLLERAESAFVEGEARGAEDRHSIGSSSLRAGNDEAPAPRSSDIRGHLSGQRSGVEPA